MLLSPPSPSPSHMIVALREGRGKRGRKGGEKASLFTYTASTNNPTHHTQKGKASLLSSPTPLSRK